MLFDFDRTLHQVKKSGQQETPRILLKLHFIICEKNYSDNYINLIKNFYILYYYIARYTEQIGTDPKTFLGFFFGLLWEWPFYMEFRYTTLALFTTIVFVLNVIYKIKNVEKLFGCTMVSLFSIYLIIVSAYYFRYILFHVK